MCLCLTIYKEWTEYYTYISQHFETLVTNFEKSILKPDQQSNIPLTTRFNYIMAYLSLMTNIL